MESKYQVGQEVVCDDTIEHTDVFTGTITKIMNGDLGNVYEVLHPEGNNVVLWLESELSLFTSD